ncbi:MAG: hypothetical protein FIB04_08775 [Gammaproteobacteria bacterium]|nr:hypothetical protein [Gammaproteobacteria bacterium]
MALSLMVLAGPCRAIDATESSQTLEGIVVTGRRDEALRRFVESLAQTGPTGQLARWNHAICTAIVGIEPAQAERMAQRIADVARSIGLIRASSLCRPSMLVIVVPDPGEVAAQLAGKYPVRLAHDGRWRLKRFVETNQPVRWLALTDPCGGAGGCALPNSHIVLSTKPTFTAIVVIVDAGRLPGYSLGEVSDYLSLVALSNPPSERQPPTDSILSMFDRPRPPGARYELTQYDRAFLAGLYKVSLELNGRSQQTSIVSRMNKSLGDGKPPADASVDDRPGNQPQP